MKIVEHTSNSLTFRDPLLSIILGRLIGGLFLILGCLVLLLVITSNSSPTLGSMILATVGLTVGITGVFFLPRNMVCFNKSLGKLTIQSERLLGNKIVEYSLSDINNVRVERIRRSKSTTYAVVLEIGSNLEEIRLSSLVFMRLKKAEERANLIRNFLNMS